jgi:hypothetical protein
LIRLDIYSLDFTWSSIWHNGHGRKLSVGPFSTVQLHRYLFYLLLRLGETMSVWYCDTWRPHHQFPRWYRSKYVSNGGIVMTGKAERSRQKHVTVPLSPPQIPHGLPYERTRDWLLYACTVARFNRCSRDSFVTPYHIMRVCRNWFYSVQIQGKKPQCVKFGTCSPVPMNKPRSFSSLSRNVTYYVVE